MTEADIATVAITWLQSKGFTCYPEVECWGGRADIVAVRFSIVWIIETKISLSADLCHQVRDRLRNKVNGVLAVAGTKRRMREDHPVVEWMKDRGIGCGLVGQHSYFQLMHMPALRRVDTTTFREKLTTRHIEYNIAGTSGRYWTPFKDLIAELIHELQEGPLQEQGLESLNNYRKRQPAAQRRALTDYLDRKLIPGWGIERRDKKLWVVRTAAATDIDD